MSLAFPQWRAVMGALVLALCLLMLSGAASRAQADCAEAFVPYQVIVKLNPKSGATIGQINAHYGSTTLETFPGNTGVYLLRLPTGSDVTETVELMANDPRLLYAEPNFFAQPPEGGARHRAFGVSRVAPTSQEYATQLGLESAHAISRGKGTKVAVLDTGAQLDHPALKANFKDAGRYDFVERDRNPSDRPLGKDADCDGDKDEMVGHGTHVAGIVDITAPAAKIMPLRVLDTEGYGDVFTIAKAVHFAAQNHADVINLSLGSPSRSRLLQEVIEDTVANGVLVAAAAGNSNNPAPHYPAAGDGIAPASADGLVAVTSVNKHDQKSDFANYGAWVDIAAPGEGIRSAFPVSKYAYWSGTSMATPFVSGQAALIQAVYGPLDPAGEEGVEERIRCHARSLIGTDPGNAAMMGAGRADVGASISRGACR